MLKWIGATLVTAASLMIGWATWQGLNTHLRLLRQFQMALEIMQSEMELNVPPIGSLFDTVGQRTGGELGAFFSGTALKMAEATGRPPVMAMRLQMEEMPVDISSEEKSMLYELGGALGRYDIGGQARAMEIYRQRIDRLIREAEQVRKQKSRAWMTASLCSGLILILLML